EEFPDGVADAVARISRAMAVAGVRRFRHPDPDELHWHRRPRQLESCIAARSVRNRATREGQPRPLSDLPDRVLARPVLHQVTPRIRFGPSDADSVDLLSACQINDDPLRMR